jgi:penicillin-binding protein 1C
MVFKNHKPFYKTVYAWFALACLATAVLFYRSLPSPLFSDPTSTVVFDNDEILLGARIADDGQWRFPEADSVPQKFEACILAFEDRHFYTHPGVNPLAIFRALLQNLRAGQIVSGASTLTMQTIRLSRQGKPRTLLEKMLEMILALRLECGFTKHEILKLYASHAPFGGNVVGLDAAAWRYYGRSAHKLSWAECATLAVLPNAPALIHPGRNRDALMLKRNRLLDYLAGQGSIDSLTLLLAKKETLPEKPELLPNIAPHLLDRLDKEFHGQVIKTSIRANLQQRTSELVNRHVALLKSNQINNAALLILDTHSGKVLAYIGNSAQASHGHHGNQVDVIMRPRSSGSVLKPLLYAAMLDAGELLPTSLVADIPTTIHQYSPTNFDASYDGAVPANEALIRSLNIPAVRLLHEFGLQEFYEILQQCGFTSLTFDAQHYGLSLILGGAEVKLWDLCKVYRGMAGVLNNYPLTTKSYYEGPFAEPRIRRSYLPIKPEGAPIFSAGAIYKTFEAMKQVGRPEAEAGWESFLSTKSIAWKTGTSFGFRDAWAIGVSPDYTVGVWVGNADGEGRPGLTGLNCAAPLMFEAFDLLPSSAWFAIPYDDLIALPVCSKSGMRPGPFCEKTDTILALPSGLKTPTCPWHELIHLDESGTYRVHAQCYPHDKIIQQSWFTLPPAMAWYYKARNPFYQNKPPWKSACNPAGEKPMQLIWPDRPTKIYLPKQADGTVGKLIFEAAHQNPAATIFWYVDDEWVGETINEHKLSLLTAFGKHRLMLVDENGNFLVESFEIVSRHPTGE